MDNGLGGVSGRFEEVQSAEARPLIGKIDYRAAGQVRHTARPRTLKPT